METLLQAVLCKAQGGFLAQCGRICSCRASGRGFSFQRTHLFSFCSTTVSASSRPSARSFLIQSGLLGKRHRSRGFSPPPPPRTRGEEMLHARVFVHLAQITAWSCEKCSVQTALLWVLLMIFDSLCLLAQGCGGPSKALLPACLLAA